MGAVGSGERRRWFKSASSVQSNAIYVMYVRLFGRYLLESIYMTPKQKKALKCVCGVAAISQFTAYSTSSTNEECLT